MRVGPTGRLFGSVTGRNIADRLSESTGRTIDHRQVLLGSAIHEPGDYQVTVRLYREVTAQVNVSVVPEGYEAAAAQEAEESSEEAAEEAAPDADEEPDAAALARIAAVEGIADVRLVRL